MTARTGCVATPGRGHNGGEATSWCCLIRHQSLTDLEFPLSAPLATVNYGSAVTDGFRNIATFVPKLIGFLLILVIGYFIAKIIATVVGKLLEKAGFDKAVERGGIAKALSKSSYDASDIVAKLVFFAIFIPVLSAAIGVLGIAALQAPLALFIALIPKILVALVLVVIGAALASALKSLISNTLGGLSYGNGVATAAAAFVVVLFVKAALDEVGIATNVTSAVLYTALAIIAGVTIVGVGGGLIQPMQARWEDSLNKASLEKDNVKQHLQQTRNSDPQNAAYDQHAQTAQPPQADVYRTPSSDAPTTQYRAPR